MRKIIFLSTVTAFLLGVSILLNGSVSAENSNALVSFQYLPIVSYQPCPPFSSNEVVADQYHHINMGNNNVWPCKSTGRDVVVAVVDTGVDKDHFDLVGNLLPGKAFDGDNTSYNDRHGHGTHVSGIIAALPNNGGVIGTAPHAKILPVRVLGEYGGSSLNVGLGIIWAVDNGADIVNLSLGGSHQSTPIANAVAYADAQGVLVIAAAGNCGDPINSGRQGCNWHNVTSYPAGYGTVMAIASTEDNDQNTHSVFSTQGGYVDASAPGRNILSTWIRDEHASISGTSMAAPNAAGVAALVMSKYPSLSAQQVRNVINNTAVDLGAPGFDNYFGNGFINSNVTLSALANGTASLTALVEPQDVVQTYSLDFLSEDDYIAGDVVIGLAGSTAVETLLDSAESRSAIEIRLVSADKKHNVYHLAVPVGSEIEMIRTLRETKGVLYAEPNFIFEAY